METLNFYQVGLGVAIFMVLAGAGWLAKKVMLGDPPWATRIELERESKALHKRIDIVSSVLREDVGKLHSKVDSNVSETAHIKGEMRLMNQHFQSMQNSFSTFLHKQLK